MIRVLVHAGFHKTGTTSLQRMLAANRDRLGPRVRIGLRDDMATVTETARAFSARRDAVELSLFRGVLAAHTASLGLDDGELLILSSEDLCGHMPGRRGVTSYDAAPELMRSLAEVLSDVIGGALRLEFLFSTRAPEAWLASLYWHQVAHGTCTQDFETFRTSVTGAEALDEVVDAVAGAVTPWPVHRAALEHSAGRAFGPLAPILDRIGTDEATRAALIALPPVNTRPPHDLSGVFLALNRAAIPAPLLAEMKRALRRISADAGARDRTLSGEGGPRA